MTAFLPADYANEIEGLSEFDLELNIFDCEPTDEEIKEIEAELALDKPEIVEITLSPSVQERFGLIEHHYVKRLVCCSDGIYRLKNVCLDAPVLRVNRLEAGTWNLAKSQLERVLEAC